MIDCANNGFEKTKQSGCYSGLRPSDFLFLKLFLPGLDKLSAVKCNISYHKKSQTCGNLVLFRQSRDKQTTHNHTTSHWEENIISANDANAMGYCNHSMSLFSDAGSLRCVRVQN